MKAFPDVLLLVVMWIFRSHLGPKLQGFPENFSMTKSYTNALKQIGNSVSVPVVDAIIKQILKVSKT